MKSDSTKVKAYHNSHINVTYVTLPCSVLLSLNRMLRKRTFWAFFLACFCLLALSASPENTTESPSSSSIKDNTSEVKPEVNSENEKFANEPALNDSSLETDAGSLSLITLNDTFKSDKTIESTSLASSFETTIESREADRDNVSLKTENVLLTTAVNETQDSEAAAETFNKTIQPLGSESHTNVQGGKSQEDEPILTFSEFQERARHSKTKSVTDKHHHDVTQRNGGVLDRSALVNGTPSHGNSKSAKTSRRSVKLKNVANADCASKVLHSSAGAMNAHAVLVDSRDDYLIFESASPKWMVVELCELAILRFVELANFELFASAPRRFRLYGTDRLPYSSAASSAGNGHANSNGAFNTAGWRLLVDYEMKDNRKASQMFPIRPSTKTKTSSAVESEAVQADVRANASETRNQTDAPSLPIASVWNAVAKYVAVEIISFYGHERFCPLTFLRVFGESVLDGELINEDDDELFDEDDVDYQFEATSPSVLQHVDMAQQVDNLEENTGPVEKSPASQSSSDKPKQPDSSTLLENARNVVFSLVSKLFGIDATAQAQAVHIQSGNQAEPETSSASSLRNLDGANESNSANETALRKGIPRRSKLISSSTSVLGSMAALCQAIFPSIASYDHLSSNLSATLHAGRGNSQFGLTPFSIGLESSTTPNPNWQSPTAKLRMKRTVNTDWCTQLFAFVPPECATKLNYSVRQLSISRLTDSNCDDESHAATNYSALNLEDMFSNARCAYYFGAFAKHVHRSSPDRPISLKRTALRLVGCYCDVLVTVTNAALRRAGWLNGKGLSSSGIISQNGAFSGTQKNVDAASNDSVRGASDRKPVDTSERDQESTSSSTEMHTGRLTDSSADRNPENTNRLPNDTESNSAEHRKPEGDTPFEGSASASKEQPQINGAENQGSSAHWPFDELSNQNQASANAETDELNEISADTVSDNFSDAQLEAIAKQLELPIPLDRLLINSEEHSKLEEELADILVQRPSENNTIPQSQTVAASEPSSHDDAQTHIEPVGSEQRFDEDIDKRYLTGSTNLLASREASFAKLIQRVKQLQTNMTISMRYLDELSQRYRRQMDTLHRRIEHLELANGIHHSPNMTDLERRISALERNVSVLQTTRIGELDGRMNLVETRFDNLASNISNSSSQSTGMRTIILVLIASQCSSVVAIAYLVYTLKKLAGRLEILEQGNSFRSHSHPHPHGLRAEHAHSSSNIRLSNGYSQLNHVGLTHTHSEGHRTSHGDSFPMGSTERTLFSSVENLKPFTSGDSQWLLSHRNTVPDRSRERFSPGSNQNARPHSADRVATGFGTKLRHPSAAFDGVEAQNAQEFAVMAGKVKRKRKKMKHDAETESHNSGRLNGDKKFIHQLNGAPSSDTRLYRSN